MTQTKHKREPDADALAKPFTPGMSDNAPEPTEFSDTIAGPVEVAISDPQTAEFVEEWRNAAYNCYSSGHKFCREVCPVMQVTRNESWTLTAMRGPKSFQVAAQFSDGCHHA